MKNLLFLTGLALLASGLLAHDLEVTALPGRINTPEQEFGISLAGQGKVIYYFSRQKQNNYTSIFRAEVFRHRWQAGKVVEELDSDFDDQTPFVSSDERIMIFSSNRDGSLEFALPDGRSGISRDLYYSIKEKGHWSKAQSLPLGVNTADMEEYPFLQHDRLYFVRYPFARPDQADIYVARFQNGQWQPAEKISSPVNSHFSEIAPTASSDGKIFYFASDRPGGLGGYDLYASEIDENGDFLEPQNLGEPINSAADEAFFLGSRDEEFFFCRRLFGKNYDIYHTRLPVEEIADLQEKKKISLDNVYFASNDWHLLPQSYPLLASLADFLAENPSVMIKIIGHTDLHGSREYNLELSLQRAIEVKTFLQKKGILPNRVITEGKGFDFPLINETGENADSRNRRIEIEIVD